MSKSTELLDQITHKILQNNLPNIIENDFKEFLNHCIGFGRYSEKTWNQTFRNSMYAFGQFMKHRNKMKFVIIIDELLKTVEEHQKEILFFIRSEIVFHSIVAEDKLLELEQLKSLYPHNPEFYHSIGVHYAENKDYNKALSFFSTALEIEPGNKVYLVNQFNSLHNIAISLIYDGKYNEAKKMLHEMFYSNKYSDLPNVHQAIVSTIARVDDHETINQKILNSEQNMNNQINSKIQGERTKLVESLSLFTAIMAFILTTVSTSQKYPLKDAVYFIALMGTMLILFTSTLTLSFKNQSENPLKNSSFILGLLSIIAILILMMLL